MVRCTPSASGGESLTRRSPGDQKRHCTTGPCKHVRCRQLAYVPRTDARPSEIAFQGAHSRVPVVEGHDGVETGPLQAKREPASSGEKVSARQELSAHRYALILCGTIASSSQTGVTRQLMVRRRAASVRLAVRQGLGGCIQGFPSIEVSQGQSHRTSRPSSVRGVDRSAAPKPLRPRLAEASGRQRFHGVCRRCRRWWGTPSCRPQASCGGSP